MPETELRPSETLTLVLSGEQELAAERVDEQRRGCGDTSHSNRDVIDLCVQHGAARVAHVLNATQAIIGTIHASRANRGASRRMSHNERECLHRLSCDLSVFFHHSSTRATRATCDATKPPGVLPMLTVHVSVDNFRRLRRAPFG